MTKNEAIKYFGSQSALARVLDIHRQAVHRWPDNLSKGLSDRVELAMIKHKAKKDALTNR